MANKYYMLDISRYNKHGKAICIRSCSSKIQIIERCTDSITDNKTVIDDFFNTDIHFDYFDIKICDNPKIDYEDYSPFIERYKQRPTEFTRMLHFSNDFYENVFHPMWKADYFWKIFENLLSTEAPVIVEISNKLREPLGITQQHEKISNILREHKQVLGFWMNEDIHYWNEEQNAWRSYFDLGKECVSIIEWFNPDLSLQ